MSTIPPENPTTTAVTVAEVSEAAVSEQARALAAAWGLLSPGSISGDSNAKGDEAGTCGGGGHFDVSRRKESRTGAPTKLGVSTAVGVAEENSNTGDTAAGSGGGGGRGSVDRPNSREEWAPLWEVMGMLSVPSVTVGATAAGERVLVCTSGLHLFRRLCVVVCFITCISRYCAFWWRRVLSPFMFDVLINVCVCVRAFDASDFCGRY